MANQPNERRRRVSTPMAVGLGVLVFLGVGGGLWAEIRSTLPAREATTPAQQLIPMPAGTKLYNQANGPRAIHYQGHALSPAGEATRLPDAQMAVVGTSDEGYLLVERHNQARGERNQTWPVGGGGGSGVRDNGLPALPQSQGAVFVKTQDGRYLPLVQQN